MTLKYFILLIIYYFEIKNNKSPTLNEVTYYTTNPGKLEKSLIKVSNTFRHDLIKRSEIILELAQLYPELIDRFSQNKKLSYKTNDNGKKQAIFRINQDLPDSGKQPIKQIKIPFLKRLSDEQKQLYNLIIDKAYNLNKNVIIDDKNNNSTVIKVKDGEPNAYLAYFSFDSVNNNDLIFSYRTRQVKILPFNKFLVVKRNIDQILNTLEQILLPYSNDDFNESLKQRIKNNDKFEEYETDTNGLLSHQKAGAILADKYDKFAFFYDTGTGKTIMALEIMKNKYKKFGTKFLAVVPKPIIKTAWMEDSINFFPKMKILPLSKNFKPLDYIKLYNRWNKIDNSDKYIKVTEEMELGIQKITNSFQKQVLNELMNKAQHYIINMDLFRDKDESEKLLSELKFTGIILDESAIIKNYESKSARRMRVMAKRNEITNFYLLSGKPAPNNDSEYYSQMKIVDPETFSMTRDDFLKEYFYLNKYNKPISRQSKTEELAKMVAKKSLVISKEDCLDLPNTTNNVNAIQLDAEIYKKYASMYQEFVTEVETSLKIDKKIKVNSGLASLMKLRQIANGFILDSNQKPHLLHNKKLNRLEEILDDIGNNQVIIWHNFDFELEMISKVLNSIGKTFVTANGKTKNLDENIRLFKENKVDIIIANLKTLKYGVTLVNSHYAIYYSLSYSFEDYYQSQARIHRYGQNEECTYFFILAEDTVDQNLYNAVLGKESRNKFFEGLLKDAVKYGVDYKRIKNLINKASESIIEIHEE
jgi:superfamily II DNA or RNA helicase